MISTNILSKVIFAVTIGALALQIGGFVPRRWITAEFDLSVKGRSLAVSRPVEVFALVPKAFMGAFNETVITFHVVSKMGLFKNCKDRTATIGSNKLVEYSCDSEGAKPWQLVAFSLGAMSLLFGATGVVMSGMAVFMNKFKYSIKFRFAIVLVNFSTVCLALGPVILYACNNKIQVKPPLPDMVTFDIGWALYLTLGAAVVCGLILLLNTFMIAVLGLRQDDDDEGGNFGMMKMSSVAKGEVARF